MKGLHDQELSQGGVIVSNIDDSDQLGKIVQSMAYGLWVGVLCHRNDGSYGDGL